MVKWLYTIVSVHAEANHDETKIDEQGNLPSDLIRGGFFPAPISQGITLKTLANNVLPGITISTLYNHIYHF